jgi:hypothetical protein
MAWGTAGLVATATQTRWVDRSKMSLGNLLASAGATEEARNVLSQSVKLFGQGDVQSRSASLLCCAPPHQHQSALCCARSALELCTQVLDH